MKAIVIVLLVLAGVGGYWVYQQSQGQKAAVPVPVPAGGQSIVNQESNTVPNSGTRAEKGNFSQKGNLAVEEGNLTLLWDEPGRMALNVKLKFTKQSTCIIGGEKKDCSLLSKSGENYYVNVEGNRSGDEVTVIKLEEQNPLQ